MPVTPLNPLNLRDCGERIAPIACCTLPSLPCSDFPVAAGALLAPLFIHRATPALFHLPSTGTLQSSRMQVTQMQTRSVKASSARAAAVRPTQVIPEDSPCCTRSLQHQTLIRAQKMLAATIGLDALSCSGNLPKSHNSPVDHPWTPKQQPRDAWIRSQAALTTCASPSTSCTLNSAPQLSRMR